MAVYFETSLGDLVFDLYTQRCPAASKNFIQLCKAGYYNGCLIYNLEKTFLVQSGDRTGTGRSSVSYDGPLFQRELPSNVKHNKIGILGYSHRGNIGDSINAKVNGSQFYITLRKKIDYLDGKYTAFGSLEEDRDNVIQQFNNIPTDEDGRPLTDIRILKAHVIADPFLTNVPAGANNARFENIMCDNGDYKPKEENIVSRVSWKKLNVKDGDSKEKSDDSNNSNNMIHTAEDPGPRPLPNVPLPCLDCHFCSQAFHDKLCRCFSGCR